MRLLQTKLLIQGFLENNMSSPQDREENNEIRNKKEII